MLFLKCQLLLQLQLVQLPRHAGKHGSCKCCAAGRRHSNNPLSADRLVALIWAASRGGSTDGSATSVDEQGVRPDFAEIISSQGTGCVSSQIASMTKRAINGFQCETNGKAPFHFGGKEPCRAAKRRRKSVYTTCCINALDTVSIHA